MRRVRGEREIMQAKRARQQEVLDAVQMASPAELAASAERLRAVMRASKIPGQKRQKMDPPAFYLDMTR